MTWATVGEVVLAVVWGGSLVAVVALRWWNTRDRSRALEDDHDLAESA